MGNHCKAAVAACALAISSSHDRSSLGGRAGTRDALSVAVVDDDDSIRFLVKTLVEREGLRAQTYASAEAFLQQFEPSAIGCLVLDLHLPGIDGLELQAILKRQGVALPVIIFTAQGSIPKAVAALKNGAVEFVEKPFENRDLMQRVREHLESESARRRDSDASHSGSAGLATLTAREREVMDRIIAGRLNKHIANELGICVKTVEYHRSRIMQKIGAHSVAELVRLTLTAGARRSGLEAHAQ